MGDRVREIKYFFSGQNFSDGLRITISVLLPSLLLAQFGYLELGVLISIGAFSVSITDSPGPVVHKRNGMLFCCLCIFVVAFITGFARMHAFLMGLEILLLCFFFSMLAVYGSRAAAIGTASLLVMVLVMDEPQQASEVPLFSALILAGGIWYLAASLLFYQILPYRPVQQALGDCTREVAKFLYLKANFYRSDTVLEETYQKLVAQQILVNEKQEAVRELLFKSRLLVKESTSTSRRLLLIFVDLVDLFERTMLIHRDYASLREKWGHTGVLDSIAKAINSLASEVDATGLAIQSITSYKGSIDLNALLEELKAEIDKAGESQKQESAVVLKKVLINLRNIAQRLNGILAFLNGKEATGGVDLEFSRFVSHQRLDQKAFLENLSFNSSIFKHSFRVALVCLFGFVLTHLLFDGAHSYWVLLTIIVILKPAFSLTKARNYQRLIGTLIGGAVGFLILLLVKDQLVLVMILILLMLGSFSFLRSNYIVFVTFVTPIVLIIFSLLGEDKAGLLQERLIDTLVGSVIAVAASYLIFPSWESEQLQQYMQKVLKANANYLQKLIDYLQGRQVNTADYKLARKDVYVSSANLSAAFQRMLSEPQSKQRKSKEVHKFVVLNHILSANIATVAAAVLQEQQPHSSAESLRSIKRALAVINDSQKKLGITPALVKAESRGSEHEILLQDRSTVYIEDHFVREQLELILRISTDIRKNVEAVLA